MTTSVSQIGDGAPSLVSTEGHCKKDEWILTIGLWCWENGIIREYWIFEWPLAKPLVSSE